MQKSTEYLLVDGYNIIFSWEKLKTLADSSLESARVKLIDILSNYQGLKQLSIILVFDAHNVKGNYEKIEVYNNITVVFTKEAETADNYIEKVTGKLAKNFKVMVATSDSLEQIIILGKGAYRISARELEIQINESERAMREKFIDNKPIKKNLLLSNLDPQTIEILENMRRGR